jgi:NAD(P)-dependent dehydrogenase (short-subunit alcohol dehydrogenase family)
LWGELTYEDWQRVLEANLTGSFLCSQRVFETDIILRQIQIGS